MMHSSYSVRAFVCAAALCVAVVPAARAAATRQIEANRMIELKLVSAKSYADPFNTVTLDAVFTEPDGRQRRMPAFWTGGDQWRVRFASAQTGRHAFRTECSDTANSGLHGVTGAIEVTPYTGDNPLFRHGGLRVAADQRHFALADGTPFFWLGDTWWMGLCQRLHWPDEFQQLAADRKAKGFNVVQIVAGLYPDMPAFDERGANEAGFPWERDYARIRPEYFDAADRRIAYLAGQGLVPCIVGAWGYHLPWLGAEKMKQHWRYLIARWGALPVVWCAAGEGAMPFYLSKDKAAESARQKREWTDVIRFIHATDPFHRLVTIHPPQMARESVTDPGVLDFDMQQTGHGSPAAHHAALAAKGWGMAPVMPVISGEARYEALEIHPTLTAAEARQAFWAHVLNSGCAGHTYGANGIWQVNRRGQPYGNSPGGNNWGVTPWDEAMRLPGSTQLGLAKKLLERYPWHHFTPHPEWAVFPDQASPSFDGPQAAGIPGTVRLIWVPRSGPIVVRQLGSRAAWTAAHFDPVSGARKELGEIRADDAGQWRAEPPAGLDHDWVLVLEAKPVGGAPAPAPKSRAAADAPRQLTLADDQLAWHFDWSDGRLRSTSFENKLSGHRFMISAAQELALNFSAALDRVQEPITRVADFEVTGSRLAAPRHAVFNLRSPSLKIEVAVHFELDGATRRKWVEVANRTGAELLLLDVELDDFTSDGLASGGGQGQPVFIEGECFAALEHPSGENRGEQGRIQLGHHPGRRLLLDATFRSPVALVSVSAPGQAHDQFTDYIYAHCLRKKKALAIYTPFGINNQWGGCPTLDDEQTLNVLGALERWQKKGMDFDYFTLDTGWVDPNSDLTRFRPTCYPNGPGQIVNRVNALGMKLGLWFATSWAAESCWDYPPALAGQQPLAMPYRLGYPDKAHEGRMFCFASAPYFNTFSNAVLYHVRENRVRFLKFDGGDYHCNSTEHGHLPGAYATEQMHEQLIGLARAARAAAPDVFVMWYWGCSSPFWALHGDTIFESGLHMEGSGTSAFPTLYYRDSVTLAQDNCAQYARNIPPIAKDSLGVWLADTRWGNFMGQERWREALVMDLGRGSLLFPNLWGNLYHLTDDDVAFLTRLTALARKNESLFLHRRNILGDPARNEVYGYAHCQGAHGFLFLNNAHFAARKAELRLDQSVGLDAKPGTPLRIASHFPAPTRLLRPDQAGYQAGDTLEIWLRPFETLMLEVTPPARNSSLPVRAVTQERATALGGGLTLHATPLDERLDARFADAARFEKEKKLAKKTYAFETTLPSLAGEQPILAVVVRLRNGVAEWRYSPVVAEITQARARIGEQDLQLVPVPDGRQFGNTQNAGCSWVVFKTRLSPHWSNQALQLAVHACLPEGVEAQVEAWVVKRWWEENTRPASDGYYNDAPS